MSAKGLRALHGWLTVLWIAMVPVAVVTGLLESVAFIAAASIYANFAGHFSSWQAGRVEVKQEDDDTERVVKEIKEEVKS